MSPDPKSSEAGLPVGTDLVTLLLLSELVGYFNAVGTCKSEHQAAEEDFAQRCYALRDRLLVVSGVSGNG